MKRLSRWVALIVLLVSLTFGVSSKAAAAPALSLSPSSGFSAITVTGFGFAVSVSINIQWDGISIPTVPSPIVASQSGTFTAIITVPTQTAPGDHVVTATSALPGGATASATFRVVDMTGAKGASGQPGAVGPQGQTGPAGAPGPAGTAGSPGLAGERGPAGPQGPAGTPGTAGAGGTSGNAGTAVGLSIAGIVLALAAIVLTLLGRKSR